MDFATIIMAAGKGTRMKSDLPKVLHEVCGQAMLGWVLDAAVAAGAEKNIVVVGHGAEEVVAYVGQRAQCVLQAEQLGTGHAVMMAADSLADFDGQVMVLSGDTPLLTAESLREMFAQHSRQNSDCTVAVAHMPGDGYGRVICDADSNVLKIVEQKDASQEELLVRDYNAGLYCFNSRELFAALRQVKSDNAQGEYYLTDVPAIMRLAGKKVRAYRFADGQEVMGANSRVDLAVAGKIMRRRINESLMLQGVTIVDPDNTYIAESVTVATDTIIHPGVWLEKNCCIGSNCEIGPSVRMRDVVMGDGCTVQYAYLHECKVGDNVNLGPFVQIRPGTIIADNAKIGNFIEIKNSFIGEGSKTPHLSYIGDTDMGSGVNIGCGVVTVNYDGKNKHRTCIEDKAFVGCNANLVAPVQIGTGAYVAAGSTITKDVPGQALAVARAQQKNIDGWVERRK